MTVDVEDNSVVLRRNAERKSAAYFGLKWNSGMLHDEHMMAALSCFVRTLGKTLAFEACNFERCHVEGMQHGRLYEGCIGSN